MKNDLDQSLEHQNIFKWSHASPAAKNTQNNESDKENNGKKTSRAPKHIVWKAPM